jgi:hypothetical protein
MASKTKKARKSLETAEQGNDMCRAYLMQTATFMDWGYEIPEYQEAVKLSVRLDELIDKLKDMVTQVDA